MITSSRRTCSRRSSATTISTAYHYGARVSELRSLESHLCGSDTLAHPSSGPCQRLVREADGSQESRSPSTLTIGENYSRLAEHPEYLDEPLYVASSVRRT